MTCTAERHGTRGAYVAGCRCPEARAANTAYARARDKRTAQAQFGAAPPFQVDVELARRALHRALDAGWTLHRIQAERGIRREHLARIKGGTTRPVSRIRWETYKALLDLATVEPPAAAGQLVDGTGTHRRLQALMAIGWPKTQIAQRLGLGRALQIRPGLVTVRNAEKVRALYEQLWQTPGPSQRARTYAADRGWLTPLWWDDERIDDPTYDPRQDVIRDEVSPQRERRDERLDAVHRLTRSGLSISEIADRLNLHPRQVVRDRATQSSAASATGEGALAADTHHEPNEVSA